RCDLGNRGEPGGKRPQQRCSGRHAQGHPWRARPASSWLLLWLRGGWRGLAERLKHLFGGEDGYGNGPITEGGCNTPNFSEAGVTKGKGLWQEDDKGYLIQGVHNGNATEGHPRCQIGGTVPVEKVNGSWRLCKWALPYVTTGKIVSRITHDQRFNGAGQKYSNNKRPRNCVPTV
ncbi:unnamed protein product, partial [Pylaiella littoralis]